MTPVTHSASSVSPASVADTEATTATVGILAGMGPAAGVDFARLFLQSCDACLLERGQAINDQAYPEHWLAQVPIVDRTRALNDPEAPQPLEAMRRTLGRLADLGAQAVAISCNTAHAWHAPLQASAPGVQLLHIAQETVAELARRGTRQAALLATTGTYRMGLYDPAFEAHGIRCIVPDEQTRRWLMEGIYDGVKVGRLALAEERFVQAGMRLREQHGDIALVMACTEIPLALPQAVAARDWPLVDPSAILARALARAAYRM